MATESYEAFAWRWAGDAERELLMLLTDENDPEARPIRTTHALAAQRADNVAQTAAQLRQMPTARRAGLAEWQATPEGARVAAYGRERGDTDG